MAEELTIAVRPLSVLGAIGGANGLTVKHENTYKEFDEIFDHLCEVAGVLEEAGISSSKIKAKVKELLKTQKGHQAHIQALKDLERTYACSLEPTDFKAVLEAKAKATNAADDPNGVMAEFEQKVTEGKRKNPAGGGGGGGGDQDEDIMLTSQAQVTTNLKCPITAKLIDEIEEPVQDQKGYVYEKKAIEHYIRAKRGAPCPCPQSGTSHIVALNDLKPARNVERMRKRQKLMQKSLRREGGAGGGDAIDEGDEGADLLSQ